MKTVHQQITYSVRTCSARFLSCCEGLEFLSSDCGVWFSTVELVGPDTPQVTDWLHTRYSAKKFHSCPGSLANMTGPIGEVTNLVTLLAGATFGATKLWKVVKKAHTLSPGLALTLAAGPTGSS